MTPPVPGRYYPVVGNALRTFLLLAAFAAAALAAASDFGTLTEPMPGRYVSIRTGHVALGYPIDFILLDVDASWKPFRVGASLGGIRWPPEITGPTLRAGCTIYERPLRYMESWPWGSDRWEARGVYGFLPEVYAQVEVCPSVGDMDGGEINSLVIGTVNCACEYYFVRAGAYVGGIAAHSYNYDRTRPFDNWQLFPAFGISATLGSFTTGF